jgi:hypothetical protein
MGAEVGVIAPAGDSTARFEIVSGNVGRAFSIDAESGTLRVHSADALDFERQPLFELRVKVVYDVGNDSARRRFAADLLDSDVDQRAVAQLLRGTDERTLIVHVLDAMEPPLLVAHPIAIFWQPDSDEKDDSAVLHSIDPDSGDSARYEILAGDPQGFLQVDPDTGRLSLAPGMQPPEGRSRLPVTVRVTDAAGLSDATTVIVDLVRFPEPQLLAAAPDLLSVPPAGTDGTPEDAAPPPVPGEADPTLSANSNDAPMSAGETPESVETVPAAREALSRSGLISRFVPVLLMCVAAFVAVDLLRRRRRARAARGRRELHRGAQTLSRPLPGWLSGEPQTSRPPAVVAIPSAQMQQQSLDPGAQELVESRHADEPEPEFEVVEEGCTEAASQAARPLGTERQEQPPEVCSFEPPVDVPSADGRSDQEPPFGHLAGLDQLRRSPHEMPPAFAGASDIVPADLTHDSGDLIEPETLPARPEPAPSAMHDTGIPEEPDTYCLRNEDTPVAPEPRSEVLDEGSYVGGWTQDDFPYEDADVAAVREAADALQDSPNPMGLDPRVAALREQLSSLFGVSLDQPPAPPPDADSSDDGSPHSFGDEPPLQADAASIDAAPVAVAPAVAPVEETAPSDESDPVRSWLAYLKNRNAPVQAPPSPPEPGAPAAVPAPPVAEVPAVKPSAPLIRQNKSAVRLEISHLRDVANRHTRGVLAVKASEQKARLWWFLSGAGMVVLCFVSMALLKSQIPLVRWCGWAFLCGAAVNLAICVNSFQKLKSSADHEASDDGAAPPPEQPPHDAPSITPSDLMSHEMEARLEALMDSGKTEQPREVNA